MKGILVVSMSLTNVDCVAINTGLVGSFSYADFTSFGCIPRSEIAGSFVRSIFSCLKRSILTSIVTVLA